jgi:hypothetical protein
VQEGSSANDFIAASNRTWGPYEKDHFLPDIITIRVWQSPVQIIILEDHALVMSGVCKPLS